MLLRTILSNHRLCLVLRTQWCTGSRQVCTSPKHYSLNTRLRRIGSTAEAERFFKAKDKVPENFELIYRSVAGTYLSAVKYCVILSTAAVVGLAGWQLLSQGALIPIAVPDLVYGGLVAKESDLVYFATGFVLINIAFSAIIRRYPLRMYKNAEKYIAIFDSQLPLRAPQQHYFNKGSVKELQPLFNPWKDCYFRLGNRNALLFSYYFKTPAEFNNMF